ASRPRLRRALLRDELSARARRLAPGVEALRDGIAGIARSAGVSGAIIRVESLRKFHGKREILRGIDAEVRRGETIAIVGPSGGGKSTFLRCLNGLTSFDSGTVSVAGLPLAPRTPPDASSLRALR